MDILSIGTPIDVITNANAPIISNTFALPNRKVNLGVTISKSGMGGITELNALLQISNDEITWIDIATLTQAGYTEYKNLSALFVRVNIGTLHFDGIASVSVSLSTKVASK